MSSPVWVLSVDLQAKTAVFQSGMANAARSARGAFDEIKSGSKEMGSSVGGSMFASRHAIMAVSEAFGVQMPRAITALIAHVGPLGAALEAAFPFAAIGLAAVLLIEHLNSLREAGVKLTDDQIKFGTAAQNAFNTLDQKILQAEIRTDELKNDHLGALALQLKLIDMQSMQELVHEFTEVAKAADVVFTDLKSYWYTFGIGSDGAKNALDRFQTQYESLLAQGKDKEASDLLRGTRESAEHILALQKQAIDSQNQMSRQTGGAGDSGRAAHYAAIDELKKAGVGTTEKEVKAQQQLVDALNAQLGIESRVALNKDDKGNAKLSTGKELAALQAEGARQATEHSQKMAEIQLAAEREQSNVSLAMKQSSIAEKLAVDTHLADEELRIQLDGNAKLVAALDKGGKDYTNQVRALNDKAEEMTAQHAATIAELTAKAAEAQYKQDLRDLEQSEREKIEATEQGSAARLAAIDAAIKTEQSKNLQLTQFYRELEQQRVETQRAFDGEAAKQAAEAGKIDAENTQKMGELSLAAEREQNALRDSARRVTDQQRIAEETQLANDEYALKITALVRQEAALDKGNKDYQNKLKELQNQEKQ